MAFILWHCYGIIEKIYPLSGKEEKMAVGRPAIDVNPFNDFLSSDGKKSKNEEFQKTRFIRITDALTNNNPLEGNLARGNLETYFCNYDLGIAYIKKAISLSSNTFKQAWNMLLDTYVKIGDWENAKETYLQIVQNKLEDQTNVEIFFHLIDIYLDRPMYEFFFQKNHHEKFAELENIEQQLNQLNISLDLYRYAISMLYKTFFDNYNGTISLTRKFDDSAYIIAYVSIDDPVELFELNNSLTDKIMALYIGSDENSQEQLNKLNFFFQAAVDNNNFQVVA